MEKFIYGLKQTRLNYLKIKFYNNLWWKYFTSNLNKICAMICGT
jgi:hypothetical protein